MLTIGISYVQSLTTGVFDTGSVEQVCVLNTFGKDRVDELESVQTYEQSDDYRGTGLLGRPLAGFAVRIAAVLVAGTDRVRTGSHQQLEHRRRVQLLIRLRVDVAEGIFIAD